MCAIIPLTLPLHVQCIIGVVPLGTGNDLARVLGWGAQCGDEDKIPSLMAEMENSRVQLLDRWSIGFTKETSFSVNSLVRTSCVTCAHYTLWASAYMYIHTNV